MWPYNLVGGHQLFRETYSFILQSEYSGSMVMESLGAMQNI
jgi:hypothetical protein